MRDVRQLYDTERGMFLPDRFVKGTCPRCGSPNQNGDSCEVCGATYTPADLIDPVSVVSGTRPVERTSEHYFVKLGDFEPLLREWVSTDRLQPEIVNKLEEWFAEQLRDWDISRDAPYFGFEIPDAPGKYFYVWFDAPIGYMASFQRYCDERGLDFDEYWAQGLDRRALPLHRQGHPVLPLPVLAGDAPRRGLPHADLGVRPRLAQRQRREDVEVARHLHHRRGRSSTTSTPSTCATTTRRGWGRASPTSTSASRTTSTG